MEFVKRHRILLISVCLFAMLLVSAALWNSWKITQREAFVPGGTREASSFPVATPTEPPHSPNDPIPTFSSSSISQETSPPPPITAADVDQESSGPESEPPPPDPAATPPPPIPAVFGALSISNISNMPGAAGLEDIAQEFNEKVKQAGWDNTSETYRSNWQKAAQEADDILRARYGTEAYLRMQQGAGTN